MDQDEGNESDQSDNNNIGNMAEAANVTEESEQSHTSGDEHEAGRFCDPKDTCMHHVITVSL